MSADLRPAPSYRHEALLYADEAEYVEKLAGFIREGVRAGEPTHVVVPGRKVQLLRDALGTDAELVSFGDMEVIGANPARIIGAWKTFLDANASSHTPLRGIGEPIWAGRTSDELAECQHHERLLNHVPVGPVPFWLVCPYDTTALDAETIAEAARSHPAFLEGDRTRPSDTFTADVQLSTQPLPEPHGPVFERSFDGTDLSDVRASVLEQAMAAGLPEGRAEDLVFAAHELVTNHVRHGAGSGSLRIWRSSGAVLVEIAGQGRITDPLAGRLRPPADSEGGFGLWLVTQLCDLVQIRGDGDHSVVRVHMRLR